MKKTFGQRAALIAALMIFSAQLFAQQALPAKGVETKLGSAKKNVFPPKCILLGKIAEGGLLLELPNGEKVVLKEDNTLVKASKSSKQMPPYGPPVPLELLGLTKEGTPAWKKTDGKTISLDATANATSVEKKIDWQGHVTLLK
jgi:hypothetical protein